MTRLICLVTRLWPSVRALVTPSARKASISGHHLSIVPGNRVDSGMFAVAHTVNKRVRRCAVSYRLERVGQCAARIWRSSSWQAQAAPT